MKKTILLSFLLSGVCALLHADSLSFVTVMSDAVGSFSQVETSDVATAETVTLRNNSTVSLRGTSAAQLGTVSLEGTVASTSTLSGNVNQFKTKSLTVAQHGEINGSALIANQGILNSDAKTIVHDTFHTDSTLTTRFAGTNSLNVNNGNSVMKDHLVVEMGALEWASRLGDTSWGGRLLQSKSGTTDTWEEKNWLTYTAFSACQNVTDIVAGLNNDGTYKSGELQYRKKSSIPGSCTAGGECENCTLGDYYIDMSELSECAQQKYATVYKCQKFTYKADSIPWEAPAGATRCSAYGDDPDEEKCAKLGNALN